jgi:hypothetical protein
VAAKRYAVLNKDGTVANVILIDGPLRDGFDPGYGAALLCLEGKSEVGADTWATVLDVAYDQMPEIGDTVDVKTGAVTKFVPQIFEQEQTKIDGSKETVMVASAPKVALTKEAPLVVEDK